MVDAIAGAFDSCGLAVNISKTAILSWLKDGKNKRRIYNSTRSISIRNQPIKIMKVDECFDYLGVGFTPNGRSPISTLNLRDRLGTLKIAPLKPQQRLFFLIHFLLPSFYHRFTFSKLYAGTLKKLDVLVRDFVRSILHLPSDAPKAIFHASIADGGIGVPSLRGLSTCRPRWGSFRSLTVSSVLMVFFPDNHSPTQYSQHPHIYTDGSKMPGGTAFAFVVHHHNIHLETFRLTVNHSIYQAELLALDKAIHWALKSSFNTFTILTDNKSATLTLQQFFPEDSIAHDILTKIKYHPLFTFNIGWIWGHTNIEGNVIADNLAKSPILDPTVISHTILYPLPASFLKLISLSYLIQDWESLWHSAPARLYTFQFFQKPTLNLHTDDQTIIYFLTGHRSFPSFLYKIGRRDDDLCNCGNTGHPLHYVYESCPPMKYNSNLDLFQNFVILIRTKQSIFKLRQNYNILNTLYSFIRYTFT